MAEFEMKFDPRTIEHLGVRMYSTLPPALGGCRQIGRAHV